LASRGDDHDGGRQHDDGAFAVATAPTTPRVEAILWRYSGNAHRKASGSGRITPIAQGPPNPGVTFEFLQLVQVTVNATGETVVDLQIVREECP
jgi:hypothetical protein